MAASAKAPKPNRIAKRVNGEKTSVAFFIKTKESPQMIAAANSSICAHIFFVLNSIAPRNNNSGKLSPILRPWVPLYSGENKFSTELKANPYLTFDEPNLSSKALTLDEPNLSSKALTFSEPCPLLNCLLKAPLHLH